MSARLGQDPNETPAERRPLLESDDAETRRDNGTIERQDVNGEPEEEEEEPSTAKLFVIFASMWVGVSLFRSKPFFRLTADGTQGFHKRSGFDNRSNIVSSNQQLIQLCYTSVLAGHGLLDLKRCSATTNRKIDRHLRKKSRTGMV